MVQHDYTPWLDYPMGPAIQQYFGITDEDYRGQNAKPDPSRDDEFREFFSAHLADRPFQDDELAITAMEELNLMDLPDLAFAVFDQTFEPEQAEKSFDICMVVGTSLFMLGEVARGESYFHAAYELDPEKEAAIINLAQICYASGRDDEALDWIEEGFALNKNHQKLWELYTSLKMSEKAGKDGPTDIKAPEFAPVYKEVKDKAFAMGSYLGVALASDLLYGNSPEMKKQEMARLYDSGVREPYFLVEYTAILGECQQYQQLVQVAWQAMNEQGDALAWQVIAHGVQGHLAMEQVDEAKNLITALERREDVPPEHLEELKRQTSE